MKMIFRIALLLLIASITGCGTAPVKEVDTRPEFSLQPQGDNGRLIVSHFQVPKDEIGVGIFHFMALLGGAKTTLVPFKAKLYDVTDDEPKYIGFIWFSTNGDATSIASSGWLEYSIPKGKRILMLDRSATYTPDFLEVNINPGETTYIAVSQYGYMSYAYLGEIAMQKQDYDFCFGLQKGRERASFSLYRDYEGLKKTIDNYMADNRIHSSANTFRNYCLALAFPVYVDIPPKTVLDEFEKSKPAVIALRDKNIEKWKSDPENKTNPFDLRHWAVHIPKPCSNEVKVCPDGTKVMRTEKNCQFEFCPSGASGVQTSAARN